MRPQTASGDAPGRWRTVLPAHTEGLQHELIGAVEVGREQPGKASQPRQQDEMVVSGRRIRRGHGQKRVSTAANSPSVNPRKVPFGSKGAVRVRNISAAKWVYTDAIQARGVVDAGCSLPDV